tara:strand:+ start:475 stop:858 length:384 start_codon:yes stop_codon:yes gene_type:complete
MEFIYHNAINNEPIWDNNTLNTHLNNVNQGIIITCDEIMRHVNNEQPNLNNNVYIDVVLSNIPNIHEEHLFQYIYYDLNILNRMNVYLSDHNIPPIYNIVSLVSIYRRVYASLYIINNMNPILARHQ